jgi:hypothetical protein
MNKTVDLVDHWAAFEQTHPEEGIEDFCRHYIASRHQQKTKGLLVGGMIPPINDMTIKRTSAQKNRAYGQRKKV